MQKNILKSQLRSDADAGAMADENENSQQFRRQGVFNKCKLNEAIITNRYSFVYLF